MIYEKPYCEEGESDAMRMLGLVLLAGALFWVLVLLLIAYYV